MAMNVNSLESRDALDVDFSRYVRTLRSRWLLIAVLWGGTVGLAGIVASLQLPTYEASTKVLVRTDPTSTLTGVGRGVGDLGSLVKAQNPLTTEVEIISSKPVIEEVIQRLGLKNAEKGVLSAEDFYQQLTVEIVGGADVISFSYQDTDPSVAAAVVNELARLYLERNAAGNQQQTLKALASVEGQLPVAQKFVRETEAKLRSFREDNQIIALDEESKSLIQLLEGLDGQISEARAALSQATAEANSLQSSLGLNAQEALAVSDISQSPAIQGILQELQSVERNKATQRGIYTDQSPVVLTAQAKEANLRQLLEREVKLLLGDRLSPSVAANSSLSGQFLQVGAQRQSLIDQFLAAEVNRLSLTRRAQSLSEFRENYRQRATSLPVLKQEQEQLEQTLGVARSSYQSLLQRLKELEAAGKQDIANATVIEPAEVPKTAIAGERSRILALGGLLGAFLATTVVTLLTLREEDRLRRSNTAIVGMVPHPDEFPAPSPFRPEGSSTGRALSAEENSASQTSPQKK